MDKKIQEINSNPNNTFTVGHNLFSTWTDDEYSMMQGEKYFPTPKEGEVKF
jgi:hypothetical protein